MRSPWSERLLYLYALFYINSVLQVSLEEAIISLGKYLELQVNYKPNKRTKAGTTIIPPPNPTKPAQMPASNLLAEVRE
jgi:hypothetical protein